MKSFHATNLPVIEITPGGASMTAARKTMSLAQFVSALDAQRTSL